MMDAKALLSQFLAPTGASGGRPLTGPTMTGNPFNGGPPDGSPGGLMGGGGLAGLAGAAQQVLSRVGGPGSGQGFGGMGGFGGGAAAGGLMGLLLGGRKGKGLGGLLSHGGAAALGALAHRAYQDWQRSQPAAAQAAPSGPASAGFLPAAASPTADGQPFELALVRAMIAAAKADGHVDAAEQGRIFAHVERLGLEAEAKAWVFDTLAKPVGVTEVAAAARTPAQASELYLVSRLAIDPDQPGERAYLDALAHRLALPPGLAVQLDQQAAEVERGAP